MHEIRSLLVHLHYYVQTIHLIQFHMAYITVPYRSSSCVKKLHVDALAGRALVEFKGSGHYEYENVSRRAIINVLFNPDVSLGFWVNNNLTKSERAGLLASDNRPGSRYSDGVLKLMKLEEPKLPVLPTRY